MKAKELLASLSAFSLTLPAFFQTAFTGISELLPLLLLVSIACLTSAASMARNLSRLFVGFFAPYLAAAAAAIALTRQPLDALLGSASGDLATLVAARNVILSALVAAPFSAVALVVASYLAERHRAIAKIILPLGALAALAALAWLAFSYNDWYNEVYAVKSLSAQLESIAVSPGDRYPLLSLKVALRTDSAKALEAIYLRYNVRRGSTLIRQVADNFPSGLAITREGVLVEKVIELPEGVTYECFEKGVCSVQLQVVARTRFGLAPIDFTLASQG